MILYRIHGRGGKTAKMAARALERGEKRALKSVAELRKFLDDVYDDAYPYIKSAMDKLGMHTDEDLHAIVKERAAVDAEKMPHISYDTEYSPARYHLPVHSPSKVNGATVPDPAKMVYYYPETTAEGLEAILKDHVVHGKPLNPEPLLYSPVVRPTGHKSGGWGFSGRVDNTYLDYLQSLEK